MFIQPNFLWWGRLKSRMISGPHLPRADTRGHMFEFSGYSANSTPSGSYTPGYTPGYPGKSQYQMYTPWYLGKFLHFWMPRQVVTLLNEYSGNLLHILDLKACGYTPVYPVSWYTPMEVATLVDALPRQVATLLDTQPSRSVSVYPSKYTPGYPAKLLYSWVAILDTQRQPLSRPIGVIQSWVFVTSSGGLH